jgi:pyruvate ferredoxin oxidoreductase alpha subunit
VEDVETVVVALGSVLGTIDDVVDQLRDEGVAIGSLGVKCFRPWPSAEIREALQGAKRVVVVEKAFAVGAGGIVGQNTRDATRGLPIEVYDVVAGLGGRPITRASLRGLLDDVLGSRLDPRQLHFLDLDKGLVQRELERSRHGTRPGPHAEAMLRDVGTVASGAYE